MKRFFLVLLIASAAFAQSPPNDEQRFCEAFPKFQQALEQARKNLTGRSADQRQTKKAAKVAVKDFKRLAGWKNSNQSVKGWSGELFTLVESTAWGHYVGASVKLSCGNVILGVPQSAVRRWSVSGGDPIASSCLPADPYLASGTSLFTDLENIRTGQSVIFAGRFCTIPDSVNNDVVYFVFSKMSPSR